MNLALDGLHPTFVPLVPRRLSQLDRRFPWARLGTVSLFDAPGDDSLGYADGHDVRLNRRWFGRPALRLRAAAAVGRSYRFPNVAPFHGDAFEPGHVLAHEFGHVVQAALGGDRCYEAFLDAGYDEALDDPATSPTGYALVNRDEWFAETFSLALVGGAAAAANGQVTAMRALLASVG